MNGRPVQGENLADFAVKVRGIQEFVASCYNAVAIPRYTIEEAQKIEEENNG